MEKFYTRSEAAEIIELFEDILDQYDVSVPSPEDNERDKENMVGLYGSTYSDLLDSVESAIIDIAEKSKTAEIVTDELNDFDDEEDTIYTRSEAADIVALFENILDEHGISIPSPEDDERGKDNSVGLFGSTYYDLLDNVESAIIDVAEKSKTAEIVTDVFNDFVVPASKNEAVAKKNKSQGVSR